MEASKVQTSSRVEKRKALKRQQLINSALQLFEKNGYINTPVSDITSLADTGHGTFYEYFNNKKDLLIKLAEELNHVVNEYFLLSEDKNLSVQERLFFRTKGLLEFFTTHKTIIVALKEASLVDKDFEDQWNKIHGKLFRRVESDIKGSIRKGFCRDIDTDVAIVGFTCMLEGYGHYVLMQQHESIDIDAVARSLADIIYHGIFLT